MVLGCCVVGFWVADSSGGFGSFGVDGFECGWVCWDFMGLCNMLLWSVG